ncbi:hypothetical protein [Brevibacillus centrosporus]|uniref:hypothetical protein n=1 Tax=Brevibacillus centrosporus TaxID=54910 RepID=UPI002E23A388|nr:hypothetical protein [Brevibacillus centrosporus]
MKETADSPVSVTSTPNKVRLSSEEKASGQIFSQVLETEAVKAEESLKKKDKYLLEGK